MSVAKFLPAVCCSSEPDALVFTVIPSGLFEENRDLAASSKDKKPSLYRQLC